MNNKPGFAPWEKWALMSIIILGLSGIIIYFNYRTFGMADGLPYTAVIAFIILISLLITRHIRYNPVTTNFLRAAFVFEVLLTAALALNVVYSLSVMREMSVASQAETSRKETLDSISKLRGSRAQRQALEMVKGEEVKGRQTIFADKERWLFWIMIAELGIGVLATFVLLGLSVFDKDKDGVPDVLQRPAEQRSTSSTIVDKPQRPAEQPRQDGEWRERPAPQLRNGEDKSKRRFDSH